MKKRKPLMMMRTRGISGTRFSKHFRVPGLSKSIGFAYSPGGALSTPTNAITEPVTGNAITEPITGAYITEP